MGHRLSKIYTRTGDGGTTGLGDGSRTDKDAPRLEAIGNVDELNSTIALILAAEPKTDQEHMISSQVRTWKRVETCLLDIQHKLFNLGGELSLPGHQLIYDGDVDFLEAWLDELNADLAPLKEFILPGGGQAAAACHLARAVCRRAERSVVTLARHSEVNEPLRRFLNRLSDLLFVIARVIALEIGAGEVYWRKADPDQAQ